MKTQIGKNPVRVTKLDQVKQYGIWTAIAVTAAGQFTVRENLDRWCSVFGGSVWREVVFGGKECQEGGHVWRYGVSDMTS